MPALIVFYTERLPPLQVTDLSKYNSWKDTHGPELRSKHINHLQDHQYFDVLEGSFVEVQGFCRRFFLPTTYDLETEIIQRKAFLVFSLLLDTEFANSSEPPRSDDLEYWQGSMHNHEPDLVTGFPHDENNLMGYKCWIDEFPGNIDQARETLILQAAMQQEGEKLPVYVDAIILERTAALDQDDIQAFKRIGVARLHYPKESEHCTCDNTQPHDTECALEKLKKTVGTRTLANKRLKLV